MIRRLLTTLILWILVLTLIPPPTTAADPPPTTSTPNTAPKRPTDCATTFAANPELIKYQAAVSDHYRDVHKLATGMGVTIGIIDTGVAPHPGYHRSRTAATFSNPRQAPPLTATPTAPLSPVSSQHTILETALWA